MDITAEQIRTARERSRMTQQELADNIGVSLRTVGSWERGETIPRNRIGALAELLGLEVGGREFGRDALKRRLGELARERRQKDLGVSREAMAASSGIQSTKTIRDFEYGATVPQDVTKEKLERALGWRRGAIDDVLRMVNTKASNITMDMVDSPALRPAARPLKGFATADLLKELLVRLPKLVEAAEAVDADEAEMDAQYLYGLAANNDPSHLERLQEGTRESPRGYSRYLERLAEEGK